MSGEGCNNKTAEGAIKLIGRSADVFGIGSSDMLVSLLAVLDETILPISETFGVGHLRFAEAHGFCERADGAFATLGERSGVRVLDGISVRATITGAHDDAFITG